MNFFKALLVLLLVSVTSIVKAQTSGNGGSKPWVVLTSNYDTSPFNDTTLVDIYFDGSSYTGYVTSVQFKVKYDGSAFDSVYTVEHNLSNDYLLSFNDDRTLDEVLVSLVYIGASTQTTIPNIDFVTIKLANIHNSLLYFNQENITPFTFAGYNAVGSNSNATDISIGTFNHGGVVNIPHRKFSGYVLDYQTGKGIPGLEYRLQRDNSVVQTVLSNNPTTTAQTGYYEMVYYEYFYGYITEETDFDFFFKTEDLDSDAALTTADAYKLLLYANNKITLTPIQTLAGDVNHSHTITIADAYTKYAYQAGTYNGWSNLGQGGYRDVMIIKPEDIKYLTTTTNAQTALGIGPLGFEPQTTNWVYDLNAYGGIEDLEETFYTVILGDVNGTSIGGTVPSFTKINKSIQIPALPDSSIDTSILAQLPNQNVVTGDEFFVDLVINTKKLDVHSFNFELEYDPEILHFIEASTPFLANSWMLYFNANQSGKVRYGGIDGSAGNFPLRTDTLDTILRFKFKALSETGISETPIEFGDKYATGDRQGDDLPTIVKDGRVYLTVVTSNIDPKEYPQGFKLEQNYPNPFNPSTIIPFTVVNPQRVSLDLYKVDGTFVQPIYEGFVNTGTKLVEFDARTLPSGVYIYKLTANKGFQFKKLTIIK